MFNKIDIFIVCINSKVLNYILNSYMFQERYAQL